VDTAQQMQMFFCRLIEVRTYLIRFEHDDKKVFTISHVSDKCSTSAKQTNLLAKCYTRKSI